MSREALDFCDIRGDISFLNGIYTAYVEEILHPALKEHLMLNVEVNIFSIGDEREFRADTALSKQVKKYLELGSFDKDGVFTPLPSNDDFHFPFEEEMKSVDKDRSDEILTENLILFLKEYAVSEDKLAEAVKLFVYRVHWFLYSTFDGVYLPGPDVISQLKESTRFQTFLTGALFLRFGTRVMLLTTGYYV